MCSLFDIRNGYVLFLTLVPYSFRLVTERLTMTTMFMTKAIYKRLSWCGWLAMNLSFSISLFFDANETQRCKTGRILVDLAKLLVAPKDEINLSWNIFLYIPTQIDKVEILNYKHFQQNLIFDKFLSVTQIKYFALNVDNRTCQFVQFDGLIKRINL